MKQYFEFVDEKSAKFWEIDAAGNSFTVRFGKIGSDGQLQVKEFENEEEAIREAEKLIKEKIKKGYIKKSDDSENEKPAPGKIKEEIKKEEMAKKLEAEKEAKTKKETKTQSTEKPELQKINFRKKAFVKLDHDVEEIINIEKTVIFWGKKAITGYDAESNKVLWRIHTERFIMGTDCERKLFSFNNKAVFVSVIKVGADFVFCVDPGSGRILWAFTERVNTRYKPVPSITKGNLIPVINRRKEDFIDKPFILFLDIETGKKVHEIYFSEICASLKTGILHNNTLLLHGSHLVQKLDKTAYNSDSILCVDINSLDKGFEKIIDGEVCSFYQKENFIYFILKYSFWNDAKKIETAFSINKYDPKTKENISIPWPEKANPFILQEILDDDNSLDSDRIMISWGTRKYEKGERKVALFDFNKKKFIWTDTYDKDFMPTQYGIFFKHNGTLRNYNDGSMVETNANDFDYSKLLYGNKAFYFYLNGGVEIVSLSDKDEEALNAARNGIKEYTFKEEIKKFNIREYGLNNI